MISEEQRKVRQRRKHERERQKAYFDLVNSGIASIREDYLACIAKDVDPPTDPNYCQKARAILEEAKSRGFIEDLEGATPGTEFHKSLLLTTHILYHHTGDYKAAYAYLKSYTTLYELASDHGCQSDLSSLMMYAFYGLHDAEETASVFKMARTMLGDSRRFREFKKVVLERFLDIDQLSRHPNPHSLIDKTRRLLEAI